LFVWLLPLLTTILLSSHHQPENILVDASLTKVKLADFGSCQRTQNKRPFTVYSGTRWYRAPECVITNGFYGQAVDVWGAGCVLFELITLRPLFPGIDEDDQIKRIHDVLGSPTHQIWKKKGLGLGWLSSWISSFRHQSMNAGTGFTNLLTGTSQDCLDLLAMMLKYDCSERITSQEALKHSYFREFRNQQLGQVKVVYESQHTNMKCLEQ
jgi:renal tumor antigen